MSSLVDASRLEHCGDTPGWMRWQRIFDGHPDQAGRARGFVACLLAGHEALDDGVSVTSEFVGNVLRHTRSRLPGGTFAVEAIDRAEAWRRADAWLHRDGTQRMLVAVEELDDLGYVAHPVPYTPPVALLRSDAPLLVIDGRTGRLTRWPQLHPALLAEEYRNQHIGGGSRKEPME